MVAWCNPGAGLLIRGLMVRVHQGALMRNASCRKDSRAPAIQGFFHARTLARASRRDSSRALLRRFWS